MPSVSLTGDSANALSRTVASVKCVPAKPPFTAVSVSNLSGSVQQLNVRGKIYVSYTARERSRPRAEGERSRLTTIRIGWAHMVSVEGKNTAIW